MGFVLPQMIETKVTKFKIGQYYESLGYDIPKVVLSKQNAKINNRNWGYDKRAVVNIDVRDLWYCSGKMIECTCDNCNKLLPMTKATYTTNQKDGKIYCRICALKLFNSGENNKWWNPDITDEERAKRRHRGEREFSQKVLKRDDYICQCCHTKINHNGVAHHLDGWDWCKEKRLDISNGITLCETCHKNFHTIYGYGKNTKEQFEEWIGSTINLVDCNIELPTSITYICLETKELLTVKEIATRNNIKEGSIYNYAKKHYAVKGKHYFFLSEYKQMSEEEINDIITEYKNSVEYKKIILLNTGQVFDDYESASNCLCINKDSICEVVTGKRQCVWNLIINGYPLIFMRYIDYIDCIKNNRIDKLEEYKIKYSVICLSTGKLYANTKVACKDLGYDSSKELNKSLKENIKFGNHPITNELMSWIKYSTFINLSNKDQNKIFEMYKESFLEDSFLFNFINEKEKTLWQTQ